MAFIVFVAVLSVLIIAHEIGHFIAARRAKVTVEQFSLGFGPRLLRWKRGDTEYIICAIPLGGFVKMAGDNPEEFKGQPHEYLSKTVRQRAKIVFYGPLLNYALAFFCFSLIFFLGIPTLTSRVGNLVDGFGAQEAGIQTDDKIIAVNGQPTQFWYELQEIIQRKEEGDRVNLVILRRGEQIEAPVEIKQEELETIWGKRESVGLIGIQPADEFVTKKHGLIESIFLGGRQLLYFTWVTYKSLAWMVLGRISFRDSVTGPVGIFHITTEAASLGFSSLVQVIGVISMSLAIFNLLPLPVLDGGHLLLLFVEKIRGRRLSINTERRVSRIGFSIILLLIAAVLYNDLVRYGIFERILRWWG